MSCGAVLLSAGTKGYRYMAPHAYVMIHEVSGMEFGKLSDVKSGVRHQEHLNKVVFALIGLIIINRNSYKNFHLIAKVNMLYVLFQIL